MKNKVKNLDMTQANPFELQNSMASDFTGTKFEIYRPVKHVEVNEHNVLVNDNKYKKINSDEEAYVEYELSITGDDFIYMFFSAPKLQNARLFINGDDKGPYFNMYDWSVRECGYFNPGDKVSVRLYLEEDEIEIDNAYFYYESAGVLKMWYKEASQSKCNIEKIKSSHLKAEVDMSSNADLLVFSIPYEKDWTVTIDGNKVTPIKVMDALLAVKISEGKHEVELKYFPIGIKIGLPVTILSIIILIGIIFFGKRKDKSKNKL